MQQSSFVHIRQIFNFQPVLRNFNGTGVLKPHVLVSKVEINIYLLQTCVENGVPKLHQLRNIV